MRAARPGSSRAALGGGGRGRRRGLLRRPKGWLRRGDSQWQQRQAAPKTDTPRTAPSPGHQPAATAAAWLARAESKRSSALGIGRHPIAAWIKGAGLDDAPPKAPRKSLGLALLPFLPFFLSHLCFVSVLVITWNNPPSLALGHPQPLFGIV